MTAMVDRLRQKYFGKDEHPYRLFERVVDEQLRTGGVLLDAGCGRTAPVLVKYRGKAGRLIGVDLVDFESGVDGVELHKCDLAHIPVESGSVDLVMARSVLEHLVDPLSVYREVNRILKPGGMFVFLTANLWDYASIIARLVPNAWHPWVVSKTEGRAEADVFPIAYRTNTRSAVHRLAGESSFEVAQFRYLGQYPAYFSFNAPLFLLATGYEKLIGRFESLHFLRGWIFAVLQKR